VYCQKWNPTVYAAERLKKWERENRELKRAWDDSIFDFLDGLE
jgi:hypothetical protein